MTGVLNVDTIADNAGTGPVTLTKQEAAKVYFTVDTSGTAEIDSSFNVASMVDSGTGHFKINFTNNMSDSNWPAAVCGGDVAYNLNHRAQGNATLGSTTSKGEFACRDMGNTDRDTAGNTGTIFGDLA